MQFSILNENIKKALATVAPAVAGKSTLPVLSNVLLSVDDSGLTVSATNLEAGITTTVGARVEQHGSVTLPAKLLSDLIGGLPNEVISFNLNDVNQEMRITCGKFRTAIKGIEADEFPILVTTGGDPLLSLPVTDWQAITDQVAHAAADDKVRPLLAGVYLKISNEKLIAAAADSYKLARKIMPIDGSGDLDLIIPGSTFAHLRKIFTSEPVSLALANNGGLAVFSDGTTTLTSRLIEGQYPDVTRIIPTTYSTRIVIDSAELRAAIKLALPFAAASSNILVLDLAEINDQDGKLGIVASASQIGEHSAVLECIASGMPVKIKLNAHFLLDAVNAIGSGDLAIELTTPSHPAVLRPVDGSDMLQIIMPMTTND